LNSKGKKQHIPGSADLADVYASSGDSVNRMDDLPERLGDVRRDLGMSQSSMDQALGLGKNSWQRYENGKNVPGSGVIATLVERGYNANWILTGLGSMKSQMAPLVQDQRQGEFEYVPKLVSVEVSTGPGASPDLEIHHQFHAFRRDWLASKGLQARSLAIVDGRGDSMEPTIANGSTLLVDTSVTEFQQEGIYVVRLDGHLFAKRLQRGQGGAIFVISDNTFYQPIEVDPADRNDFNIIGKVVWLGRDM